MNPFATRPANTRAANLLSTYVFDKERRPVGFKRLFYRNMNLRAQKPGTPDSRKTRPFPNVPQQAGFDMKKVTRI
jgi:hypothetical protein